MAPNRMLVNAIVICDCVAGAPPRPGRINRKDARPQPFHLRVNLRTRTHPHPLVDQSADQNLDNHGIRNSERKKPQETVACFSVYDADDRLTSS